MLLRTLLWMLVGGVLAACGAAEGTPGVGGEEHRPAIRAVTLDAREVPGPDVMRRLQALGVTHVTLTAFGFQPGVSTPEIRHNPDARWYSESDAGIRALAGEAAALGMGVILKPHIWVSRGAWRGDIGFETEADWEAWEADYHALIMHYAQLAQETDAALLVVGTELAQPARQREAFWRGLIADVRAVYDGELTYAANWYDEYEYIGFWDALDYVGVQAYFPLCDEPDPTPATIRAGWQPHVEALAQTARSTGKPILLTELGYRSVAYAAAEPWRWPARDEIGTVPPDPELQAQLYEAFFETVWPQPWLAGVIVWKWYPSASERSAGRRALDFTPQDKPAEAVIAKAFRGD